MKLQNYLLTLVTLSTLLIPRLSLGATRPTLEIQSYTNTKKISQVTENSILADRVTIATQNGSRCFTTDPTICIDTTVSDFSLDLSIDYRKAQLLAEIAAKYASAGQYPQATELARSIAIADSKISALAEVAFRLAKAGQGEAADRLFSEALQRVGEIPHEVNQLKALGTIAKQLQAAGLTSKAQSVFSQYETLVVKAIPKIGESPYKVQLIVDICQTFLQYEKDDAAFQLIQTLNKPTNRSQALAEISLDLAEKRQYQKAEQFVLTISDASWKIWTFSQLSLNLRELGQVNLADKMRSQALNIVQNILPSKSNLVADLMELAEVLTDPREYSQIVQVAKNTRGERLKSYLLSAKEAKEAPFKAIQLAKMGKISEAIQLANTIRSSYQQILTLTDISIILLQSGRVVEAEKLISETVKSRALSEQEYFHQVQVPMIVAIRLAEAQQFAQSEKVLQSIQGDSFKALTLLNLADRAIQEGNTDRALQRLSQTREIVDSFKCDFSLCGNWTPVTP